MIEIQALTARQLWLLKALGNNGHVISGVLHDALGQPAVLLDQEDLVFVAETCEVVEPFVWSDREQLGLSAAGWAIYGAAQPAIAHLVKLSELAEIIAANAYRLYQALAGSLQDRDYLLMTNPQVGDLVLELTSMIAHNPALNRLGRLLEIVPGKHWPEYRVQLLHGEEVTWGNAKFIRVFESIF